MVEEAQKVGFCFGKDIEALLCFTEYLQLHGTTPHNQIRSSGQIRYLLDFWDGGNNN